MAAKNKTDAQTQSYVAEFIRAYNGQSAAGQSFFLSPQLLNSTLKNVNMKGAIFSREKIERMVLAPHQFEQELRQLSYSYYNSISIYRHLIDFTSSILDFDWEPIPYTLDGKPITASDYHSKRFQKDYKVVTNFFNRFNVKREFNKVMFNISNYDTYYTSFREFDDHAYLQELPAEYCMIDADSYLGYLFSFNLSYFVQSGVDIDGYAPCFKAMLNNALQSSENTYGSNLDKHNGRWVYYQQMHPDDVWVFKYNNNFAGSVPPVLDMFLDYSKLSKFKDLEEAKKELEAYKVIFASVPRLQNGKMGNKVDDFAISAEELGKFVATVKESLGSNLGSKSAVDFKAAPLENFKMFDFSPSASEKNLLETEMNNMVRESGMADAILQGGNNVSSINLYKQTISAKMEKLYPQFASFCEYHINKNTDKYKFKIKFVGTMFDREDRRKAANEDMERGIITPAIFSSRGIQITDAANTMNFMHGLGFPQSFTPIQTASTMSSEDKKSSGRTKLSDDQITDSGEQTRNIGANEDKKEA